VTHIFLVVGAPAVGKSTTAHALAGRFPKSIHIPVDDVRDMVVSGLVHPGEDWGTDIIEQLTLARGIVVHMAKTYSQAGFVVAIDDFWDPNSRLMEYAELFREPNAHRILLYPSQQAAEERNRKRSGPNGETDYIAGGIHIVYENLRTEVANLQREGWVIVDTTDKSIEATVDHILAQIK
jgi:predicted kinase